MFLSLQNAFWIVVVCTCAGSQEVKNAMNVVNKDEVYPLPRDLILQRAWRGEIRSFRYEVGVPRRGKIKYLLLYFSDKLFFNYHFQV